MRKLRNKDPDVFHIEIGSSHGLCLFTYNSRGACSVSEAPMVQVRKPFPHQVFTPPNMAPPIYRPNPPPNSYYLFI